MQYHIFLQSSQSRIQDAQSASNCHLISRALSNFPVINCSLRRVLWLISLLIQPRPVAPAAQVAIVWYMELTKGGCEALVHLYEKSDGRITIMVPDFEGLPKAV